MEAHSQITLHHSLLCTHQSSLELCSARASVQRRLHGDSACAFVRAMPKRKHPYVEREDMRTVSAFALVAYAICASMPASNTVSEVI